MLEGMITWSLRHRALVLAGAVLVMGLGILAQRHLNVDAFPDTTPVQVQINTTAPSLVPEEVERQITVPIELAMTGMPGLVEQRSISQFGLSQVVVTFADGTDIYFARQLIFERLSGVTMPPGVPRPEMGPVSTGLGEVFQYLVTVDSPNVSDARTTHDWLIKKPMLQVPGTAEINSWGGFKKQYQVRIDPVRLIKHSLTFDQVIQAIRANNLNVGGGSIDRSGEMLLVHGIARTNTIEAISNIAITAQDGVPIHLRDVAEVTIGHEIRRGMITANGQGEAVLGLGFMRMGENSYSVTHEMAVKLEEIKKTLPENVKVATVYDRTTLVDQVIDTVRNNLCEGALLVVTILYVFLGNLRAGLIVALAIPLSMLFAFCGMQQIGIAGTLLSLGAIDFGVVVDSSVVVVENIFKQLAHHGPGADRLEVIRKAAIEVRKPTVFGQLIIMIVYIPILTLEGVEGKMFQPMAITVILVLLGSLVLSLSFMPVAASLFLPKQLEEHDVLIVRWARKLYTPLLDAAFRLRWAVAGISVALLGVALVVALGFGSEFVPRLSEGAIVIGIVRAPGTSLSESLVMNSQMERALLERFPDEVSQTWSRCGAPEVATDPSGTEMTDLFITLRDRKLWKRATTQSELVSVMEKEMSDFAGQTMWFTQPIEQRINEMISGVRSDVALKLFGEDFETLIAKAREMEQILRSIPGCVDLATEKLDGQPMLQIRVKPDEIARYGLPARTVLDLVESSGSIELGEILEGERRFPFTARLPDELRTGPESLGAIMVATPAGERIPLRQLADIKVVLGPKTISREQSKRRITVQCNVRGRDVGSFVKEAQQRIAAEVQLPPSGYFTEWGGQFENLLRAQKRLTLVVPLALLMIVVLLFLTYRNLLDTLLVFSSVPFACVGGVLAMALRGMPLSISSAVGFITLSGVSVLNGMVLVSALRDWQNRGHRWPKAVREASIDCLRTIMMTALVASVGFVPMATSKGTGAEVQQPLATVVIGGVISSTLMTLFALPVFYLLVERFAAPKKPRPVLDPALASA